MTKRVGLIGYGAIGQSVTQAWLDQPVQGHVLASVLVRPHQQLVAQAQLGRSVQVTSDLDAFLANDLDLVVELAGQSAVVDLGARILRAGVDLMILSVGALARQSVVDMLMAAATARGASIRVPVGATAGLDGLLAMRRAGLKRVVYTSTKPPKAWQGTPAASVVDLDAIDRPTLVFTGTAREAAMMFPKNANLAAAVALAGLGFDQTTVVLRADPQAKENVGCIEAEGLTSSLTVIVAGRSEPANPKSSRITGVSVLSALENDAHWLAFA